MTPSDRASDSEEEEMGRHLKDTLSLKGVLFKKGRRFQKRSRGTFILI